MTRKEFIETLAIPFIAPFIKKEEKVKVSPIRNAFPLDGTPNGPNYYVVDKQKLEQLTPGVRRGDLIYVG